MLLERIARRALKEAMVAFSSRTFFGRSAFVRDIGFDVISRFQPRILCTHREKYVVRASDKYIGREVFVTGEFGFDKFDRAMRLIAKHRSGRKPTVLIDVGANIGTICIPAVARGYVERSLAIEPEPDNMLLLRANIALNDLNDRITAIHAAAGPEDGKTLLLELASENFGDHRVRVSNAPGAHDETQRAVISVPSQTLDTLAAGLPLNETFLWMDVQGFEGLVLTGARSILDSNVPMVVEFSPYHMDRARAFELLYESVGHYSGFIDLNADDALRPMRELRDLRLSLRGEDFTDIVIV